jgi:hypothetical protein
MTMNKKLIVRTPHAEESVDGLRILIAFVRLVKEAD